jgi:hypothetical protein
MLDILKAGLVAATILSAPMAQAGGPVLIEEGNNELIEEGNDALIAEAPARRMGVLPLLGIVVLVGLVAGGGGGGGGGGAAAAAPEPCVKNC